MKLLILTVVLVVSGAAFAQDKTLDPANRYMVILDKKYEPLKEIHVGDKVRIKLINSTRVKGQITSIDSTFFKIDSRMVHLHEVRKISTKKEWVKFLGVPFVAYGGLLVIIGSDNIVSSSVDDPGGEAAILLGIPITAAGVGLMGPGYHKIGKFKRLIIMSNPPR